MVWASARSPLARWGEHVIPASPEELPQGNRRPVQEVSAPVGVFDSGPGGLSVLREIRRTLPQEDVVYLADTAHQPYGSRSQREVRGFCLDIVEFLCQQGVKMVVIACNTATVAGETAIKAHFSGLPVVGMIGPAVRAALRGGGNRRIGVLGTALTVASKAYDECIRMVDPSAEVMGVACPDLIRIAQKNLTDQEDDRVEELIRTSLQPLFDFGAGIVLLGCTDLGNMRLEFERAVDGKALVIDPAEEVAKEISQVLLDQGILKGPEGTLGMYRLLASGSEAGFNAAVASKLLKEPVLRIGHIDLQTRHMVVST